MPSEEELREEMQRAIDEGADLLDLGGYSTRPQAPEVSEEEEWRRLKLGLQVAVELCREQEHPPMLSVDTFRYEVAKRAIEEFGVGMINDVTGGQYDERIYGLVAETGVQYVLMHMRGTPQTMTSLTDYDDVVEEVGAWLEERVVRAESYGVRREQLLLDPGFGFAKNLEQEYRLVHELARVAAFGLPLLVGISRKSMLTRPLGIEKRDALPATTALHWELLRQGASVLRVHDVAAARQVVDLYNFYETTALTR